MTPAGLNIAMPEPAPEREPVILYAGWVPPLTDIEVNSTLADIYHSNPPLALALAADWERRTRRNLK